VAVNVCVIEEPEPADPPDAFVMVGTGHENVVPLTLELSGMLVVCPEHIDWFDALTTGVVVT
jgi:hypothetical protein